MEKLQSNLTLNEGDALAIPLKVDLYVVCRVLSDSRSEASKRYKKKYKCRDVVQITCCHWYGPKLPQPSEMKQIRDIRRLTHHSFTHHALAGCIDENVPHDFVHVGVVPTHDSERQLEKSNSIGWDYLRNQEEEQWDRDAVHARDKAEEEIVRRDVEWQAREKRQLASLTLEQRSKHRFLKEWDDPTPAVAIRKSRKLLRDTAKRLIELGDAPSINDAMKCAAGMYREF